MVPTKVRYINTDWKYKDVAPKIGSKESRREHTAYQDVLIEDARPHLENGKIGLEQTGFTLTNNRTQCSNCLLYTSDAADDSLRVELGGRRIIKNTT